MSGLSKSKIIAFRQCPKRLWLEIHQPEQRDDSASEAVFATGYQVGDVARRIYDPKAKALPLISEPSAIVLRCPSAPNCSGKYRAGFRGGRECRRSTAYADVMLPDRSDGTLRWKMIEVKSSTKLKDYHLNDIAVNRYYRPPLPACVIFGGRGAR